MPSINLDRDTADRMLSGDVRSADAPPGYERLCELFDALRDTSGSPGGFGIAPAPRTPARTRSFGIARGLRRSTVAFAVALSLTGGAAFAAGLPQRASHAASSVLDSLGVSIPGLDRESTPPSSTVPERNDARATSRRDHDAPASARGKDSHPAGKTTSKGGKKGATKGSTAGGGNSNAGENPGRGYGRGGRHGGNPPGHAVKQKGRGHAEGAQPGVPAHGQSGKPGNSPKGKPAPAGGPKTTDPGGKTKRSPGT